MSPSNALRFGIVGAAGRGGAFREPIERHEAARIEAVCDPDTDALRATDEYSDYEQYGDYYTMLWESDLDVVLVGSPAPHHVHQSIAALKRDIDVISEVPAGKNVGECRALVEAVRASEATYLMAENYVYMRPNMVVRELVEAGLFGELYYAEGEYLHELKAYDERTKWRRTWKSGINGIPYPTHSLGPILTWFSGDRVARVTCAGSGHHYTDPEGAEYVLEDTTVMLGETEQDRLLKIRFDRLSERPHAPSNYQLQGTKGCYESARTSHETDKIWLADFEEASESGEYEWTDLRSLPDEYTPSRWRDPPPSVEGAGHGGADDVMMTHFIDYLAGSTDVAPPVGIDAAMDMTLPGLVSLESIDEAGEWCEVPDSRSW